MRHPLLVLTLAALVSVASCGGGDDEPAAGTSEVTTTEVDDDDRTEPAVYAEDVCGSIGVWYGRIEKASAELVEDANALSDDAAAGKELVLDFLDDAIGFTDELVDELDDAGVPDTDSGESASDKLVAGIEEVRMLFQGAREDTEALPVDDPQALGAGLQEIGAALEQSSTAVGENFEEVLASVEDPELGEAFEGATSCGELATIS
ncbi:MAG: hypothetical protein WD232_08260 [Acidimicrobiales bacterium]